MYDVTVGGKNEGSLSVLVTTTTASLLATTTPHNNKTIAITKIWNEFIYEEVWLFWKCAVFIFIFFFFKRLCVFKLKEEQRQQTQSMCTRERQATQHWSCLYTPQPVVRLCTHTTWRPSRTARCTSRANWCSLRHWASTVLPTHYRSQSSWSCPTPHRSCSTSSKSQAMVSISTEHNTNDDYNKIIQTTTQYPSGWLYRRGRPLRRSSRGRALRRRRRRGRAGRGCGRIRRRFVVNQLYTHTNTRVGMHRRGCVMMIPGCGTADGGTSNKKSLFALIDCDVALINFTLSM